jgi:hypothetical protein
MQPRVGRPMRGHTTRWLCSISTQSNCQLPTVKKAPSEWPKEKGSPKAALSLARSTIRRAWPQIAYRLGGKQKLLALGVYPRMEMKAARDARAAARDLLDARTDPSEAKKQDKRRRAEADTFAPIVDELSRRSGPRGKPTRRSRRQSGCSRLPRGAWQQARA